MIVGLGLGFWSFMVIVFGGAMQSIKHPLHIQPEIMSYGTGFRLCHLYVHVSHPELQDSVTSIEVLESTSCRKGQCM